jgi:chromosome segregation ATPase
MRDLVSRTDEQAYSILKENGSLKTSARQREAQMLDLLSEVSTLNTEIALIKDEREDMNREIGKLTAVLSTISTKRATKRVSLR